MNAHGVCQPRTAGADADAELMLRAGSGDDSAFELLMNKHRPPVVRYLVRLVRSSAIAEELAQEAFLRVYKSRADYRPTAAFTTWLYQIARRLALNWIRDNQREFGDESIQSNHFGRRLEIRDNAADVDRWLSGKLKRRDLRRALRQLPDRQRRVVVLHKIEGMGCIEISDMLSCSHLAVRSLLVRAYVNLRQELSHLAVEC